MTSQAPHTRRAANLFEMAIDTRKLAARRFVEEALDGGSYEALLDLFALGAARHFPAGDQRVEPTPSAPPLAGRSMKTDVHHLYGEGDYVTIHLTHHVRFAPGATFRTRMGVVEVGGKAVEWNAMVVLRFEGDKIAEEWVVRDELQILMQLGVIAPLPSGH
jgi:SnoaL-like polyketide cyclase